MITNDLRGFWKIVIANAQAVAYCVGMITSSPDFTGVDSLCNRVMVGVANMLKGQSAKIDCAKACEIMREEIKAFFYGNEYANERDCLLRQSLSEQTVILSIITRCVERILA